MREKVHLVSESKVAVPSIKGAINFNQTKGVWSKREVYVDGQQVEGMFEATCGNYLYVTMPEGKDSRKIQISNLESWETLNAPIRLFTSKDKVDQHEVDTWKTEVVNEVATMTGNRKLKTRKQINTTIPNWGNFYKIYSTNPKKAANVIKSMI